MLCLAALLFLFLVGCSDSARKVGETGAAPAIQFPVGEVAGDKLGASICLSALEIVSRHKAVWRSQPSRTPATTEMIVQSHERVIDLLPAVPAEWGTGHFDGVRVRGGFELNMAWENEKISSVEIISTAGKTCRINAGDGYQVSRDGEKVAVNTHEDGSIEFDTVKGGVYLLSVP